MKAFLSDLLKKLIVNIAFVTLTAVGSAILILSKYLRGIPVTFNLFSISLVGLIITTAFILNTYYLKKKDVLIYRGREQAQKAGADIFEKGIKEKNCYVKSTRISFWSLDENSQERIRFRNLINLTVSQGICIQRIWQLHTKDDLNRLVHYLEVYKLHDNYSLKYFISKSALIPELLCINGKIASISIPQKENPRRMATSFHFLNKNAAKLWEDYFDILWEICIPIKTGEVIRYDEIDKLQRLFSNPFPSM